MATQLEKLADVLEKTAVYLDAIETEKLDAIRSDRKKLAGILKDKYEDMTGDVIDEDVLQKIADSDIDVLAAFERLTKTASSDDLGTPADRNDTSTPLTVKEAAEVAGDRFENWIMGE
jgi:hypothetical protein